MSSSDFSEARFRREAISEFERKFGRYPTFAELRRWMDGDKTIATPKDPA